MKFQDYYQTLEVPRTASADEIKQGFRKLARVYHPDVAKNKVTGEEKFKRINEAYEVLGDPEKRKRYDQLGERWQEAGTPGGASGPRADYAQSRGASAPDFEFEGTGFSDFFESFFSGGHGGRPGGGGGPFNRNNGPSRGEDVEAYLLVSLEESLRGSRRKISLRRPGDGTAPERVDTYQVTVPHGVHAGQKIRLAGQGGLGSGGGPTGDLYLVVRLARHPEFDVNGDDLDFELDVAPWEAVLGAQITIPVLDGSATVRVPPGSASESRLRLRGQGLPRTDGTRGDLYANVRVKTPNAVSVEERALWEKLAETSAFKPRSKS